MNKKQYIFLLFIGLSPLPVTANEKENRQLAVKQILKIEDFLPDKKAWTISTGVKISQRKSQSFDNHVYQYEIAPNISIPYIRSVSEIEKITGISSFASVQYGLTKKASIFSVFSGSYRETTTTTNNKRYKSTSGDFDSYTLGANYQLDTFNPLNILTVSYSESDYAQSPSLGLVSSWIFDPVVLSLSTRYQNIDYERGENINTLAFKGVLSFAVNPEVTIKGGVQNKFNFSSDESFLNDAEVDFGIGMTLSESVTMITGIQYSVVGNDSFSYDFKFSFKV
ncbi:hypothetical protein MOV00_002935 [Vibrio vulnificus]|uniref:hypothetical protein n=1 Tax=Vibrio vulnificus TaxID=672 RepID=UPI001D863871|nr:hypothetical protein [Vibrio vulnificus]EIZ1172788.1 hypothetical protein [Vibrio vulnificus]EKG2461178.1 hypothetical protein [Vibrio vulnificus]ELI9682264.1 hypothetical protein [Vibrio vulnificus]MCU8287574.1 hypothetical protein [Vibrio vulnificus]